MDTKKRTAISDGESPTEIFFEEMGASKKFNYDLLIDWNLNNLLKLAVERSTSENLVAKIDDFRLGVEMYSLACLPYHDKPYKDDVKKAYEVYADEQDSINIMAQQWPPEVTQNAFMENRLILAKSLFRAIIETLNRHDKLERKKVFEKDGFGSD